MKLRTYRSKARAQAYANKLAKRFPGATFEVRISPIWAYPFSYLIRVQGTAAGHTIVGRSYPYDVWVGR